MGPDFWTYFTQNSIKNITRNLYINEVQREEQHSNQIQIVSTTQLKSKNVKKEICPDDSKRRITY